MNFYLTSSIKVKVVEGLGLMSITTCLSLNYYYALPIIL